MRRKPSKKTPTDRNFRKAPITALLDIRRGAATTSYRDALYSGLYESFWVILLGGANIEVVVGAKRKSPLRGT